MVEHGLNPIETSRQDIANWLVYRSEHTKSPNVLESNFKAVKCFRQAASKPVLNVHVANSVLIGLLKTKEAKSLLQLGLEPEIVQEIIHKAFYEFVLENFVGVRQAALYALMYYGTARFGEVKELELRQISKKGTSIGIQICKGKLNQT